jgi:hypothetical protein
MVPFDGTTTATQQSSQHGPPSIPRPPMAPGHHAAPSLGMSQQHHGQSMNAGYHQPSIHRQHSTGIPAQPNFSIPPSPSTRHNSFGGVPSGGVHYQTHTQPTHHPLRSPAGQQQQGHHSMQMQAQQGQNSHQSHPQHMGMGSVPSQNPNMGSGVMQDNRQRNYIATGMNGNWQSDKDMPHRREMIQQM